MDYDIIVPGNETEIFSKPERYGYAKYLTVYSSLAKALQSREPFVGVLVHGSNKDMMTQGRKAKEKGFLTLTPAQGYEKDKFVIEKTSVDILFDFELVYGNDHLHYRKSGLNQVLCQLAVQHQKTIAFSLHSLLASSRPEIVLGRLMQNIRFCKKYNVKTIFATFAQTRWELRSKKDMETFWSVVGRRQ